jgi:RNA polymerase sigma-70 factor, ECF subfamily
MSEQLSLREEEGLRAAFADHAAELHRMALTVLKDAGRAEDATYETFLRAWRWANKYDPSMTPLRTWLFAIHREVVAAQFRNTRRRPSSGRPRFDQEGEHDALEAEIDGWRLEEAIRGLGEQDRRVLMEAYYRHRPPAEVADELGVDQSTIRVRAFHALRALRTALEEVGWTGD